MPSPSTRITMMTTTAMIRFELVLDVPEELVSDVEGGDTKVTDVAAAVVGAPMEEEAELVVATVFALDESENRSIPGPCE